MLTDRQIAIRERGLAKAREMAKTHRITRKDRSDMEIMIKTTLVLLTIAIIQSIYILL
jgi:hypothetical protein